MKTLLLVFTLGTALLLLVSFMPVTIRLNYHRSGTNDNLSIHTTTLLGLVNYLYEVPVIEAGYWTRGEGMRIKTEIHNLTGAGPPLEEEEKWALLSTFRRGWSAGKAFASGYGRFIRLLTYRSKLQEFKWITKIGLKEPAATALVSGILWSFGSMAWSHVKRQMRTGRFRPEIRIIPDFYRPCFDMQFSCIFTFYIGHIIIASLGLLYILIRKKGVLA